MPTGRVDEICISPGFSTTLSLDAPFVHASVALEGKERFALVDPGDTTLKLVPSEKLLPGERLRLTLRFEGDAAPASAAFILVVHAAEAEPYVEVHREKRTVESCRAELKANAAELQQCREENGRLRAEKDAPDGLRGLIAMGEINFERGIVPQDITTSVTNHPTSAFAVSLAASYRSIRSVAVELFLEIPPGAASMTVGGAKLVGPDRRKLPALEVWPTGPLTRGPDGFAHVFVEAKATTGEAKGAFTLKLWETGGGARTITLSGVTFP